MAHGSKLRLHETIREDIAQVEAVRAAVGDRMDIMVDANQAQEPGTPGAEQTIPWGTTARSPPPASSTTWA